MVFGLVFSANQAGQPVTPSLEDVLKTLPKQQNPPMPGLRRPISGMNAQRARRIEVINTVIQDPEDAVSTVRQWMQE